MRQSRQSPNPNRWILGLFFAQLAAYRPQMLGSMVMSPKT